MSAETLRRAAALMRERAEAVKAGASEPDQWFGVDELTDALAWGDQAEMGDPKADAEHIASWHPDVALAMADWLEYVSDQGDRAAINHRARALAVARTYLGEQP